MNGRNHAIAIAIGKRPQVEVVGMVAAGSAVLVGIVALVGTLTRSPPLLALIPGPKPALLTAAMIVGLGVALWSLLRSDGQVPMAVSLLVLLVGMATLGAQAFGVRLAGQNVSVAAGLIVSASALPLLLVATNAPQQVQQVVLGTAGLVLVSLSITIGVARTVGVLDLNLEQQISGAPVPVLLVGIGFGTFFLVAVHAGGLFATETPRWLAAGSGIATLVIVLLLWLSLVGRERTQIRAQTRLAVNAERLILLRQVEALGRSVLRASVWAAGGVTQEEFRLRFGSTVREVPGMMGGVLLSATGPPVAVPGDLDLAAIDRLWRGPQGDSARAERLVYARVDSAASRIAVIAAVCGAQGCGGGLIGVIDPGVVFRSAVGDTSGGFHYLVSGPGGLVAGLDVQAVSTSEWQESAGFDVGDSRFTIAAVPTAGSLDRLQSDLPATVLFMGLVVAGLLPITLRLGQVARANAREVAQARLATALDRSTDGVWELDVVRGKAIRSSALLRYLRYEPQEEVVADRWFTLVHPDDQQRVNLELERHLAGQTDRFEVEYRLRAGDGSWHAIVDRGRVVDRDVHGHPLRMLGITADVTEATALLAARVESESRFRAVFDSAFHLQLVLDLDGTVGEVNRAALALAGVSAEKVLGRRCWETLWWADQPDAAARLRAAVEEGRRGASTRLSEELRGRNGNPVILELAVTPIVPLAGLVTQLLLEGRDDTVRRRAETALQEVTTLTTMGRLAARVAHEINNPLAGIQSAFMLVKDAIGTSHPHLAYVGAIEREIARIAAVTRQLYETYRPETESTPEASVGTVVGDAAALLGQLNKRTGVTVVTELTDLPAVIPLPSALVRQIVFNLLQNAFDASPPNGVVTVRASVSGGILMIRVRDHGPGVPDGLEGRIFEPFFSTKDRHVKTGGMGLGLSLVQRSAAAVGGSVSIRTPSGGGAEFVVELPFETTREGSRG